MAALSVTNNITLYEILSIPYIPNGQGFTVADNIGAIRTAGVYNAAATIQPEIDAYVNAMDGTTQTALIVYLTRWQTLGTSVSAIEQGQVGTLSGVTNKRDTERELIRERVRNLVPFWPLYVYLQKQSGDGQHQQTWAPISR